MRSARIVDGAGQADPLIGQEMELFGLDDHPYYNGICAVDADAIGHFGKTGFLVFVVHEPILLNKEGIRAANLSCHH